MLNAKISFQIRVLLIPLVFLIMAMGALAYPNICQALFAEWKDSGMQVEK